MQSLKSCDFIHLTDSIIKSLAQNRVTTILEFLQEDTGKLAMLTNLSLPQILAVRDDIFKKYSATLVNGASLLHKSNKFFITGIQSLDAVTGGGLPVGSITELCGLANSGKTQLCFQLAINSVKNTESTVLYIDTKGDFSAIRIQKILDACGYSHKEMALTMFKIKVLHLWTMDEIIELFKNIKNRTLVFDNLTLIIIDSLPCLMFQYLGDDNKVGLTLLNILVNYSRFLSKELNITFVVVNLQTRWVDQDVTDVEDDTDRTTSSYKEHVEKRNRCMGKYWQHIPALVLFLEKVDEKSSETNYNSSQIHITVNKYSRNLTQKCIMKISAVGVT